MRGLPNRRREASDAASGQALPPCNSRISEIQRKEVYQVSERDNSFGLRVAIIRTAKKMSQEKLAEKAGTSRNTVQSIENGSIPRIDTALPFAVALGVSPNELFGFQEDLLGGMDPEAALVMKKILKKLRAIDEIQKQRDLVHAFESVLTLV